MRKMLRTFCLGCTLCAGGVAGCDDKNARSDATTAPTVGERVDRGLDKAGHALDRAADRTGDIVAPAVDDAADRARQAGATIKEGAKEVAADLSGDVYDLLGDV